MFLLRNYVYADCNGDSTQFKCGGSTKCISGNFICDSDLDCGENDPSDEAPEICDGFYLYYQLLLYDNFGAAQMLIPKVY